MVLLVVYNPVCGSGSAESFLEAYVLPALRDHNKIVDRIIATEYVGHAGTIIAECLKHNPLKTTVILASGDGTLHEIVNQLVPKLEAVSAVPRISFVLVPMGTANALYSSLFPPTVPGDVSTVEYKLQSLRSYLNEGDPIPLTLCATTLSPAHGAHMNAKTVVSAVVTSTSLHASILHDSEALRKEIPGIDRFKVAAQQNSKQWSKATLRLLPSSSSRFVQIYDPASRAFVNHDESTEENPIVKLEGPFMYFTSAVNVDRLEPEFRITPLARTLPSREATCDIVIVRPLRDPSIDADNEQAREQYVGKIWKVMGSAYADGAHVNFRYDSKGEVTDGDGTPVVEYVRCGGWEWIPDDEDKKAHLLCSDGDILVIENGGRAVSLTSLPDDGTGIAVHG